MYICTRLIYFKLRIDPLKYFPSSASKPSLLVLGGPQPRARLKVCPGAPDPQKYVKRMPGHYFEDISPISVKRVKSLKSLYGTDMMTGCRSKYKAVRIAIPCLERSSFQSRALNTRHCGNRSRGMSLEGPVIEKYPCVKQLFPSMLDRQHFRRIFRD